MYTRAKQDRVMRRRYARGGNAGISMVELLMFIVVVSVGIVGILPVLNTAVRGSADPMRRKQAIAIAETILTEIEQQQFTYCDPNDANFSTATNATLGAGGCATLSQDGGGAGAYGSVVPGPTPAGGRATFNNVADYSGWTQSPVTDLVGGNPMNGYTVAVQITRAGGGAPFNVVPAIADPGAALRIQVTVTYGADIPIVLTGYRFRFAPNG